MSPYALEDDRQPEVEGAALLRRHFVQLDALEDRCEAFEVRPGSALDGDDRATSYDPISYQARFLFVAAFDHLNTFRRALQDHGMPIVAAYPLVRASLESAAQVLWLTTGGTRGKRVFRALHRVWDAASISDEAIRHLDPGRPSRLPRLRTRLDELAVAGKCGQRSLNRKHPSMTDIVIDAGRHVRSHTFQPIDVWRLCSSMAHGNRSVALTVLESRLDGPATEVGGNFIVTTSYRVVAAFVGVLAKVIEAALDSQDKLNA